MKTHEIELAVAEYFNPRVNIVVPNVYWSFFNYECDLIVLTPAKCVYEVEIKTSRSDLMADFKKKRFHNDGRIKRFYYAIPEGLLTHINVMPDYAGVIFVREYQPKKYRAIVKREAKNKSKHKFSDKDRLNFLRISQLRMWKYFKKYHQTKEYYDRNVD